MGGFRLHSEAEVRGLGPVHRMRPPGLYLEDVKALPEPPARLPDGGGPMPETGESTESSKGNKEAHEELVKRLRGYWVEADARCEDLRREPARAEDFARLPHGQLARMPDAAEAADTGTAR
ncbi:MerR family transcriptional regulator [Streptomyces sp. DH37]|uniref:MerR family transcriptional regulator n=1 Tax=Streptomyces sp. DH37 TaxID=3040122 RepID=UPI002442A353|nr:MerR family transcriptional regulator [Streptomyces sp. DH37]MDG9702021.1 MerR family transcriptional regulator [Streptomyces sp. DH37]